MRQFLVFLFVVVITGANAQTIFSYGNHQVTQTEFWKAYSKTIQVRLPNSPSVNILICTSVSN